MRSRRAPSGTVPAWPPRISDREPAIFSGPTSTTIYAAILRHPFVTGLTDGSLPREAFRHYIVQDAHYLRGYARRWPLCGGRAPRSRRDTVMFGEHAAGAIAAERDLHAALLGRSRPDRRGRRGRAGRPDDPRVRQLPDRDGPTAGRSPRPSAPCCPATGSTRAWARRCSLPAPPTRSTRAGSRCTAARSSRPSSTRCWTVTDRVGAAASSRELALMREHLIETSRYEWMFWDAAWRRETWPV